MDSSQLHALYTKLHALSEKSKRTHGIVFTTGCYGNFPREYEYKHMLIASTYDDWHLIPETRPVINPPSPKYKLLDIPGANSALDVTNAITGSVPFNQRTGSVKFMVENGHEHWEHICSNIANFLSGTNMIAILQDDPDYYYTGRWYLSSWDSPSNGTWSSVTLDYTLDPYKLWISSTAEKYPFDSYQFEGKADWHKSPRLVPPYINDEFVPRVYSNVEVGNAPVTFAIDCDMMPTPPTLTVNINEDLNHDGFVRVTVNQPDLDIFYGSYDLKNGTTRLDECILYRGQAYISVQGACTVTVDYRGGRL